MNKAVAGYHLLKILSLIDGQFNEAEEKIISRWVAEQFPNQVDTEREARALFKLDAQQYLLHFQKCMGYFYEDSTEKERNELIQFAINLIKADKKITYSENIYLDTLFNNWTETSIE